MLKSNNMFLYCKLVHDDGLVFYDPATDRYYLQNSDDKFHSVISPSSPARWLKQAEKQLKVRLPFASGRFGQDGWYYARVGSEEGQGRLESLKSKTCCR
jgi:hypothetical protein